MPLGGLIAALCLATAAPDADSACEQAWRRVMETLWNPKTGLIYDYVTLDESGRESSVAHLPTPQEIALQFPNPNGWLTGMEDCVLRGGPMLLAALERLRAHGGTDATARETVEKVFAGLKRCATVSGIPGFVARSLSPVDGKSYFCNSSRDQYTLFCYALWRYCRSGYADEARQDEIRALLKDVACFVKRCLDDPAAELSLLRADGKPAYVSQLLGKGVKPHESLRASMMFGAAWSVTGDPLWRDEMRRYAADGIRIAETPFPGKLALFALYQAQVSHRLLWEVETDPTLKAGYERLLERYGAMAEGRLSDLEKIMEELKPGELVSPVSPWRAAKMRYQEKRLIHGRPYAVPEIPRYYYVRAVGDDLGVAVLARALTPSGKVPADEAAQFHRIFTSVDWSRYPNSAMTHSILAYWTLQAGRSP